MYTTLATRLVVGQNGEVSQPVTMSGANAALQDATVFHLELGSATNFTMSLEGSNDLENWTDLAKDITATSEGYMADASVTPAIDIAFQYVRIRYTWTDPPDATSKAIVNAGIYVFFH